MKNKTGLYIKPVIYKEHLIVGGSVGHTAGVVNALRQCVKLDAVSSIPLPTVKGEVLIISLRGVFSWKIIPRFLREIIYNLQLYFYFAKRTNYAFIYQRHTGFSFVGAYLAKKKRVPFVLEFNSSEVWLIKNWPGRQKLKIFLFLKNIIKLPIITKIENYNLAEANIIVVVSDVLREGLIGRGIPAEKILVNPNGVDPDKFSPQICGERIREKYGLRNFTVVGFIGTFGPWHGIMEMMDAIGIFYAKGGGLSEKVRFLLVGDGDLLKAAKDKVARAGWRDKVVFAGLVPQQAAPEYLAACDIFLSPQIKNPDGTRFFGSPTKLFEYMAMGKAIVASDLEQIGQVLTHGETAILTEPGNAAQIAEAIKYLAENEKIRDSLGANARKAVLAKHTWDSHVKIIVEKLGELCAGTRSGV